MPRRSTRQKLKVPLREASRRQRHLTKKQQALLGQLSYDPQVNTRQQSEVEQSQNEYHSSVPASSPSSHQPLFDLPNHEYRQYEDINVDHTSDSSGTEIYDMRQHHDQEASHTSSEHASVALLLTSPASTLSPNPVVRSASPLPSSAPEPPSQPAGVKGTHRHQKSSRAKNASPKQAKKPGMKRTMNKRKGKAPAVRATKRQRRVKWAESTVIVNSHDGDHDGDQDDDRDGDYGDDCDVGHNENETVDEDKGEGNSFEHSLHPETPMPMPVTMPIPMPIPMPYPHFPPHHMALPPHLVPGLDPYLHSRVAYHDFRAARDILYFQYNAAAREAVAAGEPWGFLWFNSDWMEQSAASVLVELKRMPWEHAPVAVPVLDSMAPMPVAVPHSYPQPECHAHGDGYIECYY